MSETEFEFVQFRGTFDIKIYIGEGKFWHGTVRFIRDKGEQIVHVSFVTDPWMSKVDAFNIVVRRLSNILSEMKEVVRYNKRDYGLILYLSHNCEFIKGFLLNAGIALKNTGCEPDNATFDPLTENMLTIGQRLQALINLE